MAIAARTRTDGIHDPNWILVDPQSLDEVSGSVPVPEDRREALLLALGRAMTFHNSGVLELAAKMRDELPQRQQQADEARRNARKLKSAGDDGWELEAKESARWQRMANVAKACYLEVTLNYLQLKNVLQIHAAKLLTVIPSFETALQNADSQQRCRDSMESLKAGLRELLAELAAQSTDSDNESEQPTAAQSVRWRVRRPAKGPLQPTRSRNQNAADTKFVIVQALIVHHQYESGRVGNEKPVKLRKLASDTRRSVATVSRFMRDEFGSYDGYTKAIAKQNLAASLQLLAGDLKPSQFG